MKKAILLAFLLLITTSIFAQEDATIKEIHNDRNKEFRHIIKLIKEDKVNELSKLVMYPLKRQNPLPNIANSKEFIAYYPIVFDEEFKKKLNLYNDSDVFEHDGMYGLVGGPFAGDIWMDDDGKIGGININSKKEIALRKQLTKSIQSKMHPSVNYWEDNLIVGKSQNLLIRVDYSEKYGIRYVSWSKGRLTSEKPDLILYHGKDEAQGTMGGWTYTFKNGDWTYIVDDVQMCADDNPSDCGLFLRLLYKGNAKSTVRLKEIK
ncbi:hypothetical protein [uncultured Mucilaginibacter sp.]|uniref:hypothetical protein n=1 Tax=uncultured Mucilaginibacter sp. TaxID=797541 RepID=UPI0025D0A1DF|nr:hypothetical protein [uncultured Mucilaginibacter sp.]